ncbi:MAG: phosphotransferase [Actinomycetales bacterium]|nr:phosphotransferase [Actinomycetales bacterium]
MSNPITFELNNQLVTPVLRGIFGKDAEPRDLEIVALKPGAGNPTSLGVYRVSGTVDVSGRSESFSVVVKHLANGQPVLDASSPLNWNYWLREIAFFESRLTSLIPPSIGFPENLGHSRLDDGTALFWNEDLGDLTKTEWTWNDCLHAAELVAELNSTDAAVVAEYEWLNRSQVQGWAELHDNWGSFDAVYPLLVEAAKQSSAGKATMDLIDPFLDHKNGRIAEILRAGRHSFVHGDFNLNNLVCQRSGDISLIALDWQLCGTARLGTEVVAIFNTAIEHKVVDVEAARFNEICEVYATKFNELNPGEPLSLDEVRVAAAAMGYFIVVGMGFFFNMPDPQFTGAENLARVSNMLDGFGEGCASLYAKVLRELS